MVCSPTVTVRPPTVTVRSPTVMARPPTVMARPPTVTARSPTVTVRSPTVMAGLDPAILTEWLLTGTTSFANLVRARDGPVKPAGALSLRNAPPARGQRCGEFDGGDQAGRISDALASNVVRRAMIR